MLKKVFYTVKITIKYAAVPALLKIGLYAAAGVMSTLSVVFTQGLINSLAESGKGIIMYLILLLGVSVFISITGSAGSLINIF